MVLRYAVPPLFGATFSLGLLYLYQESLVSRHSHLRSGISHTEDALSDARDRINNKLHKAAGHKGSATTAEEQVQYNRTSWQQARYQSLGDEFKARWNVSPRGDSCAETTSGKQAADDSLSLWNSALSVDVLCTSLTLARPRSSDIHHFDAPLGPIRRYRASRNSLAAALCVQCSAQWGLESYRRWQRSRYRFRKRRVIGRSSGFSECTWYEPAVGGRGQDEGKGGGRRDPETWQGGRLFEVTRKSGCRCTLNTHKIHTQRKA